MIRVSKQDVAKHAKAEAVLKSGSALTPEEVEFVYENWNAATLYDIAGLGAFFTPKELALDVVLPFVGSDGVHTVVDLCAGMGRLTWAIQQRLANVNHKIRYVAVERHPDFVRVGKRLLPDVEWVEGDVFDKDLIDSLGHFDVGISNPPFGRFDSTKNVKWLNYKGTAQFLVCEILGRIAREAIAIMPAGDIPWTTKGNPNTKEYNKWKEANPSLAMGATSLKTDQYKFEHTPISFEVVKIVTLEGEY